MRLREGTTGQKALFGLLVGVYACACALMLGYEARRVGQPDIGFRWWSPSGTPPGTFMPIRADAAAAGVISGHLLKLNGRDVQGQYWDELAGTVHTSIGATNTIELQGATGDPVTVTVPVTRRSWADVWFTRRMFVLVGAALFGVCVLGFVLRPFEPASWALLCFGTAVGGYTFLVPWARLDAPMYSVVGGLFTSLVAGATFHLTLAFPVEHRWIQGRPFRVAWCYIVSGIIFGTNLLLLQATWNHAYALATRFLLVGVSLASLILCLLVGRLAWFAVGNTDRLVRQRARVLLLGVLIGFGPWVVVQVMQFVFNRWQNIEHEQVFQLIWPLALAYAAVRYELLNPRIAWRRAGALGLGGAAAVGLVWLGAQLSPALAGILLLPLLYLFPRYNARVNAWLYPKRARFSALRRALSDELRAAPTRDAVLEVLATAPTCVCDTTSGAAFVLPGAIDDAEHVRWHGDVDLSDVHGLLDEPLVHLLVGTRQTIKREGLSVDPRFTVIQDEARACMDRLHAAVLLPIEQDGKVIGGLAVGPHVSGDVFDAAELGLLADIAHDAVLTLPTVELREASGKAAAQSAQVEAGRADAPATPSPGDSDATEPVAVRMHTDGLIAPSITRDRYDVKRLLGEGGFKRVFLAHDAVLERDVALAVVPARGLDESGRHRIYREAQAMAKLGDHPNLVAVYDMGETSDEFYIVSQYMAGGDLDTRLADAPGRRLRPEDAVRVGQDLCLALAEAHKHGILHRDLKPGNVWFDGDGRAALGDFGLALTTARSRLTQEGYLVGTMVYMAPELFTGGMPSVQSDLYGLGVLLYEMLTGRRPYEGTTPAELMHAHAHVAPTNPSSSHPDVPPGLNDLILALLAGNPIDRPQSAGEVREAFQAIVRGAPISVVKPGRVSADLFVGREAEVTKAEGLVQDAVRGHGKVLLLTGEAGIGKTRLATECGHVAARRGMRVLWGRCYEGEGAPAFWPWVQILREYVRDTNAERLRNELGDGAQHVAQMVSDVRSRLPETPEPAKYEGETGRFLLFDSTTRFLKNAATAQPLTLVLEDLHWADKSSLLLLQFLAREMTNTPLLVLGTYRDEEVGKGHPLADLLGQLAGESVSERVHLSGLSRQAVAAMVEASAIEVSDVYRLAEEMIAHTEGNPFFVKAMLRDLQETGVNDMTQAGIPEAARDFIRVRLERLPATCADLLRVAAVCGREFELRELEAATGTDLDTVLATVEDAERLGLVEPTGNQFGQYWFTHALVRETMYEEMGTGDRLRLHGRVGAALETVHAQNLDPYLPQLSHHFGRAVQAGGDVDKAIDYAVRAAERATAQVAYAEAATHYEHALALVERGHPVDERRRCDLLLELAYVYHWRGDVELLEDTCLQTLDLACKLQDPDRFVEAFTIFLDRRVAVGRTDELVFQLIQEGLTLVPEGDGGPRAQLLGYLSKWSTYFPGAMNWRVMLSEEAIAMARRVGDPSALQKALHSRVHLLWLVPPAERIAAAREEYELANHVRDKAGALSYSGFALIYLHDNYMMLGRREEANACLATLKRQITERPQRYLQYYTVGMDAMHAFLEGRFADAERLAFEAFVLGRDVAPALAQVVFAGLLVNLRMAQGRLAEMDDMVGAIIERAGEFPAAASVPAVLDLSLDREADARMAFERFAAHDFTDVPWDLLTGVYLMNLCELACGLHDTRRAALLYDLLLPHADELFVALSTVCTGAIAHWLGMLAATMKRWDDAEKHFQAALDTNERIGARPFLARTQHEYARMLLTRDAPGDSAQAQTLLAEATAIYRELGMPTFLANAEALEAQLA